MTQLDGSVWLLYNNEAAGTSDTDILQWMRETAMIHAEYVQANLLGEAAKNQPKVIEIEGDGIAAQLVGSPPQPAQRPAPPPLKVVPKPLPQPPVQNPARKVHDFGGAYRIGATCKVCGVQANGLEVKDCSGKPVVNHNDSKPEGA